MVQNNSYLLYNESTSAGCGKKGTKARLLVPFIIILLANWLANKGGALQTKAFAPSILHTSIKLCPEHILEFVLSDIFQEHYLKCS